MHLGRQESVYEVYKSAVGEKQKFLQVRTEIRCFRRKNIRRKWEIPGVTPCRNKRNRLY